MKGLREKEGRLVGVDNFFCNDFVIKCLQD